MVLSESHYRLILGQDPSNDTFRLNLAEICSNSGRFQEAENLYLSVLTHTPECARAVYGLAWLYLRNGRLLDARNLLEGGFSQGVLRSHDLLYTAGVTHSRLGNRWRARHYFKSALAAVPPDSPEEADKIRRELRSVSQPPPPVRALLSLITSHGSHRTA